MKVTYTGNLKEIQDTIIPLGYEMIGLDTTKNPGQCMTGFTTAYFGNPAGRRLHKLVEFKRPYEFVYAAAKEYGAQRNLDVNKLTFVMSWINIYPPETFIKPHKHITFKDLHSCVFYIKSAEDSGELFLKDDPFSKRLSEGEAYLFPSIIEHWTTKNKSSEDRIVFGCDFCFYEMSDQEIDSRLEMMMDKNKS